MYDHIIVGGRTGECYSLKAHMPELFDAKVYMRTLERVADGGATTFTRTVNETNVGYEAGNVPGETEIINQEEQVYGQVYLMDQMDIGLHISLWGWIL